MLHLITDASLSPALVDRIVRDDDVILEGAAVWAAFKGHRDNPLLLQLLRCDCCVYALQDALSVSGIAEESLLEGVRAIDYPDFVELTVKNSVIHTWC